MPLADDFVKKHGLAPGLTSYLENQHDNGNEESQTPPMSWLNTHPPLIERIEYVIHTQVNPSLAGHGGKVTLLEITEIGRAHV